MSLVQTSSSPSHIVLMFNPVIGQETIQWKSQIFEPPRETKIILVRKIRQFEKLGVQLVELQCLTEEGKR